MGKRNRDATRAFEQAERARGSHVPTYHGFRDVQGPTPQQLRELVKQNPAALFTPVIGPPRKRAARMVTDVDLKADA